MHRVESEQMKDRHELVGINDWCPSAIVKCCDGFVGCLGRENRNRNEGGLFSWFDTQTDETQKVDR